MSGAQVIRQLQEQMNDIAAQMKRAGWPHLDFGGLCAIAGSGIAGWSAVMAGDLGLGLAGAALSVAPAVYDAFRGAERQLGTGPLTYAVLAENQL